MDQHAHVREFVDEVASVAAGTWQINEWDKQVADPNAALKRYSVAPFPQIGRGVHRLQPGEEKARKLGRHEGSRIPAPGLVYTLEKLGWVRGLAMDAGLFDEHSRQYPGAGVTAVLSYDGNVGMGWIDPGEELTMEGCYFLPGLHGPSGYEKHEKSERSSFSRSSHSSSLCVCAWQVHFTEPWSPE